MNSKIYQFEKIVESIKNGQDIIIVENQELADKYNECNVKYGLHQRATTIIDGVDNENITIEDLKIFKNSLVALLATNEESKIKFKNLKSKLDLITKQNGIAIIPDIVLKMK